MLNKIKVSVKPISLALVSILFIVYVVNYVKESAMHNYLENATVKVLNPLQPETGGTGFFVTGASGARYILTNAHVCEGAYQNQMSVLLLHEEGYINVSIVALGLTSDLCLLSAPQNHEAIRLANKFTIPQQTIVAGYPLLLRFHMTYGNAITYEEFIVGGLRCRAIRLTNKAAPGSSGSPAVDSNGNLVGVVYILDQRNMEVGMVPYSEVKKFLSVY